MSVTNGTSRQNWLNVMIDGLIAACFASGLAEAIYQFRGLSGKLWLTILMALTVSLLAVLISRRWWAIPLLLILPLAVAAAVLWRLDLLEQVWQDLANYGQWVSTWIVSGVPDPPASYWLDLLRLLIMLPLSVIFLFLVRKITWLTFYAGLILVVYIPLLIWYPKAVPALLLALCGLVLMLPRSFLIHLRIARPQDTALPRAPLQLLAIPAAILSLLFAQLIVPAKTINWRMPSLVNRINDIGDMWENRFGEGRSRTFFSIGELGFQPSGNRLGGPVIQNRRLMLRVVSEYNLLLKGNTQSIYDGASWTGPLKRSYRFDSNIWWQFRRTAFDEGLPTGSAGRRFLAQYTRQLTLDIETLSAQQATLFSAGRVKTISLDDKLNYAPYFTDDGCLFSWKGLPGNYRYTIETDYLDRTKEGFDEALLAIEAEAATDNDGNWASVRQEYLQLPESLPAIVSAKALDIAGEETTPYQKALLLEAFFQTGFTYALDPAFPPEGEDFVASFLESKTGYCVYFASALAVMARTVGIPSRYVEGFALQPAQSSAIVKLWNATGLTAHAWVELYFEGIGWIVFDPTPSGYIDANDTPAPTVQPSQFPSGFPEMPTPSPLVPGPGPESKAAGWGWLIVASLLIASTIGLLLYLRIRMRRRFSPSAVKRRFPLAHERLLFYYNEIIDQLTCLNIGPDPGETLVQYANRAERYLRMEGLSLPEVFWPVDCWLYGGIEPRINDIYRLSEVHERLESRIREDLSGATYFIRRVLVVAKRPDDRL